MRRPQFVKSVTYRFRRFSRKSYSAFQSIHKCVTIGRVSKHICDCEMLKAGRSVAVVSVLLACSATLLATQTEASSLPDWQQLTLEEVEVVAQKAQLQSENLRVVNRISKEEIAKLPVVSVADLLDYLPGVDARTRGVNGAQTDISIRGGTFDQVVIMVNGHNITDAQTGHYSADIPVDIELIDHIEILNGTSMNRFGLSAFSGAINIVTISASQLCEAKRKQQVAGKAKLQAGNFGLFNPMAALGYKAGPSSLLAGVSYNQSSGYTDNTDYKIADIYLSSNISNNTGSWNVQLASQYKGAGANSFYSLKYPNQFDATKTALATVDWSKHWNRFYVRAALSYRAHHDRFELFRETWKPVQAADWYTGHNYHLTQAASANVSARYITRVGATTAGIEFRNDNILSNVLGEARPAPQNSVFTYFKNRFNINYFLQQTILWRDLSVELGVSGNWNTMFSNNIAWTANVSYLFPHHIKLYANANQGVRLPTFTDLYYKSATQQANPQLKPEKSITSELGLSWSDAHFSAQATGYYRWGRDIIDWVLFPGEEQWKSQNLTAVNAWGAEVYFSYRLNAWLRQISATYSYCNLSKQADGFVSKYALDYLKHKVVLKLDHGIWKDFGACWTLNWQQRVGDYADEQGDIQSYKPVFLFDGSIYWATPRIKVALSATNLLNVSYFDYGGIRQPGRWVRAQITYNF